MRTAALLVLSLVATLTLVTPMHTLTQAGSVIDFHFTMKHSSVAKANVQDLHVGLDEERGHVAGSPAFWRMLS